VEEAVLTAHGLQHDREWVVLDDATNDIRHQRNLHNMHRVTARIEGVTLVLTAAGHAPLLVPLANDGDEATFEYNVWGMPGAARSEGAAAAAWLSAVVEAPVMLARTVAAERPRDPTVGSHGVVVAPGSTLLAQDWSPLSVMATASAAAVARRCGDRTVSTRRFRPNVVVAVPSVFGDMLPAFAEDGWARFHIGAAAVYTGKLTSRCSIPCTDAAGEVHPKYEPTATLRRERSAVYAHTPDKAAQPMLGISVFHEAVAAGVTLRVGDAIVIDKSSPATAFV
jgi:uncharacterized protein YcbX